MCCYFQSFVWRAILNSKCTVSAMHSVVNIIVNNKDFYRGVARIFQRGSHTGSNNIIMAFSPRYIVGCFLNKRLTKGGGGHGHPRTPLATPMFNQREKLENISLYTNVISIVCEYIDDVMFSTSLSSLKF